MVRGGAVTISLDAELAWGFHDREQLPTERIRQARQSWLTVLDLFEERSIPATWAIVGHLFLDGCDGTHADHPIGEGWFDRDPGGEHRPDSAWFGRDLIDAVRDNRIEHDIGSHAFSHVEFGDAETTDDIAAAELERSVAAADAYGIDLESFVFPRNSVGHRKLLAEYGFSCYRGRAPGRWYDDATVGSLGKLATFALGTSGPPIVDPVLDEYGLVNVPASMYLFTFEGPAKRAVEAVSSDPVVRQVELGLERLRGGSDGLLHLWLHPNNIITERDRRRLRRIVSTIAEYRDRYGIGVETMANVASGV